MTGLVAFTICFCTTVVSLCTTLYLIYRGELKREERIRSEQVKQMDQLFGGGAGGMQLIPLKLDTLPTKKTKKVKKEAFPLPEINSDKTKKDIN